MRRQLQTSTRNRYRRGKGGRYHDGLTSHCSRSPLLRRVHQTLSLNRIRPQRGGNDGAVPIPCVYSPHVAESCFGKQSGLSDAMEGLSAVRKSDVVGSAVEIKLSACDPLDLAGTLLPGPRVCAVPTDFLVWRDRAAVLTVVGRLGI